MLEAIKELSLFQQHLAKQEIGRYLDLFSNTKDRLENIVNDMQQLEVIAQ